MFGYVVLNKPEIKFKDFDMYRSFYCGLCRELRERYGISGQITLSYDMTFVILLLSALYEPPTRKGTTRCIVHPVRKQTVRKNAITEYGADMNIFLTYYKCKDDWNDEKKILSLAYGKLLGDVVIVPDGLFQRELLGDAVFLCRLHRRVCGALGSCAGACGGSGSSCAAAAGQQQRRSQNHSSKTFVFHGCLLFVIHRWWGFLAYA